VKASIRKTDQWGIAVVDEDQMRTGWLGIAEPRIVACHISDMLMASVIADALNEEYPPAQQGGEDSQDA
jgi:hypothetical protein